MAFVNRFFIWDTESTSKNPRKDAIISIGGVMCSFDSNTRKFVKIAEFHTYVHTNKPISPEAEAVHHINKADLFGQPTFDEAIDILEIFLKQHQPEPNSRLYFMAHNGTQFDNIILYCNFVNHRLNFDEFMDSVKCAGFIDSLKFIRAIFKNCPKNELPKDRSTGRISYALGNCYTSFCDGNILENAHDALVDSQALFDVCNSQPLDRKINLNFIFKHVVKYYKAVDALKRSAGVFFQDREAQTLIDVRNAADENYVEIDEFAVEPTKPIFEHPKFYKNCSQETRLCVNCMCFVPIVGNHRMCNTKPVPLPPG